MSDTEAALVVCIPARQAGQPIFSNTRIPVATVHAFIRNGQTDEQIAYAYPDLTPDHIRVAHELFELAEGDAP